MFGSVALEVGIGLSLLFLLTSLICTAMTEGIEAIFKMRAKDLERGIREMLGERGEGAAGTAPNNPSTTQTLYQHPLIFSLFAGEYNSSKRGNLPSYIPARNFAGAVIDIVARGMEPDAAGQAAEGTALSVDSLRSSADKISNSRLKRVVLSAIDIAQDDINLVRINLEAWFNGTMDRVSGWYKRRTQAILFALGIAAAVLLNIDAITVAQRLSSDQGLRQAIVAEASRATASSGLAVDALKELQGIGYPVGWEGWLPAPQQERLRCGGRTFCISSVYVPSALGVLLGWFITALAVMLGAPFWFDVLNKFMVIRSTVKPHEKSQEEASEDRQQSPPTSRTVAATR